ncbi:MAG: SatD family protein [Actinobacteria bacterium]|nr:SatD family protein [Actinomycetota bacterium]
MPITVIADIIASRLLPDREHAQRILDATIARVENDLPLATQPLRPTVGDEQQGVYPTLDAALASLLLLQLALPDDVECRYGIGVGAISTVVSAGSGVPEGPGWWVAREAIDTVHAMQQRAAPRARSWIVVAPEEDEVMSTIVDFSNAYLLARDQIVVGMTERARRLTYGRCLRRPQRELARAEGITQPAVSQALATAGSLAIVEGFFTLRKGAR